jgi:hypothetical protein
MMMMNKNSKQETKRFVTVFVKFFIFFVHKILLITCKIDLYRYNLKRLGLSI